ncbi:MAG: hypothetical protein IPN95_21665 [Bacteroidetes bacterium]|nr:hypothetical protein [Bacteroidota bacterium]
MLVKKQIMKKGTIGIILQILFFQLSFCQYWQPLSTGVTSTGILGGVSCMVVFNNQLIVGGVFDNAGGVPTSNIASWDGSNWAALQNGLSGQLGTYPSIDCYPLAGINGCINSLAIYNNELYAGGKFSNASGITVNNIAKWNGSSWSDVGGGIRFNNSSGGAGSYISSMAVYNNALHVVGLF